MTASLLTLLTVEGLIGLVALGAVFTARSQRNASSDKEGKS
jgi:hypothetical protein